MRCWNLFGHPRLNYSSGPATVVNCNLNSQLMNIQLAQQILVCFTAWPLNSSIFCVLTHVYTCLWTPKKSVAYWSHWLSRDWNAQERAGGCRPISNILSWKSCRWSGWKGPGMGGPREGKDWPKVTQWIQGRQDSEFWGGSCCLIGHKLTGAEGWGHLSQRQC